MIEKKRYGVNFVNGDYEYMLVETKSIIASTIL